MGIYGRDYMRDGRRGDMGLGGISVTTRLIVVNVALWFVYAGALRFGGAYGTFFRFLSDTFPLHTDAVFARLKVWQPLTAPFFHDPSRLDHLFFNMLFLFFFGRVVESMLDRRTYLGLYLASGAVSALSLVPLAAMEGHPMTGLGASGAVYAIGVFAALRLPNLPVLLLFVPMPLWVLVGVFMVGRELANLVLLQHTLGATVGHLAGAAVGYAFHRWRWARAPGATATWLEAALRRRKREEAPRTTAQEADVRRRVDALLAKIHAEGIAALSEEEKDFLEQASRRYPGR